MALDFNALLQNPAFLAGLSVMTGDPRNFGQNLLSGVNTASQLQGRQSEQALRDLQIKKLQSQAAFNPQQYMAGAPTYEPMPADMQGPPAAMLGGAPQEFTGNRKSFDAPGFLSGGMQAGFDPSDLASMAKVLNPMAENKLMNVAPGGAVFDPVTKQPVYTAPFKPAEAPANIREIDILQQRVRENPDDEIAKAALGKLTGADAKIAAADRAAALAEQRAQSNALRAQQQEGQQERAKAQRLVKFSNDLKQSGIPEQEAVLTNIEKRLEQYKTGEIPGFDKAGNTAANMGLTWMMKEEARTMRQAVQPLANLVIKDRSGAAVTTPEWERFKTELGTGSFMDSARLRQGLKMFRDLQEAAKDNAAAGVDDDTLQEYMSNNPNIKFKSRGRTATGGKGIDPAAALNELRKRGLVK